MRSQQARRIILIVLGLSLTVFGLRMILLANQGEGMTQQNIGLEDGNLKACGDRPNCVSTQADSQSKFYIEPIVGDNIESLWDNLNMLLPDLGLQVAQAEAGYIHCTEKSRIFGFVDDIEFLMKPEEGLIQMRSQSRVGYSDMGVNRKRIEKIRKSLLPKN